MNVAVCDAEDGYRERLVAYLMEHRAQEMRIHAFSSPEPFAEALAKQRFDAALLGKGFEAEAEKATGQGLQCLQLCETPAEAAADGVGGCEKVFRYQPVEAIIHELKVAGGMALAGPGDHGRMEVIGVCSPIGHEMQIPFSLVFSARLAESRKVIYVNLTTRAGLLDVFGMSGEYDLGDITLRIRNRQLEQKTFLKSVYETGRIHYIPPFVNPENVHDFSLEEYLALLKFLREETDYEAVVFDFGEGVCRLTEMLRSCTSAYCLTKSGFYYERQLHHFMDYLGEGAGERMHVLNLPFSAKSIRGDTDVLRQLEWSEFGDCVRGCMAGGQG